MTPVGLTALFAASVTMAQTSDPSAVVSADAGLAAETLADGESVRAIAMLKAELAEYPGDPALLINLGIAYAQSGSIAEARKSFEAALEAREVVELETANGSATDSRRLARRALAMLSRGEFRPAGSGNDQLTMNQR
ncbi:tetratricopeptide repeat protein [Qipengyuania sp. ASV99]|uniref:tetratricopeptide repeat protein n=1 Tax=Qipengyuania sp. ASV99 TaxID=3399681 RepID=UPI003A4C5D27